MYHQKHVTQILSLPLRETLSDMYLSDDVFDKKQDGNKLHNRIRKQILIYLENLKE